MASIFRNIQFLFYGSKNFGKEGFARASRHFDNSVMSTKLDGKVCMVTGANQGLGYKTSEELARRGAKLVMVCRNQERGQQAVEAIRAATGNQDVHLKVADVSSLQSVADLVADYEKSGWPLHVLVNNAGVLLNERQQSADGLELSFATNTLGAFVLTLLLGPTLKRSAPCKVIFVTSGGMYPSRLDVDDLQNEGMKKYDGVTAYSKDKRRMVAISERLADKWGNSGVSVYSMHPGWATTEGVKKSIPGFYNFYKDKFRELEQGADTIVWLALQDSSKLEPGGLYLDRTTQPKHLSWGGTKYSPADVDKLWDKLIKLSSKVLPQELAA
mmetsp:Transcript_4882/g.10484  ORF Transcript_4882/g.10484 Transcript_4882/m.10484 type:complete len:328 (-) Transcript_4882:437-1420(-)|eukprot:CAMPEP_0202890126 /NCGR_PEP_ID=MMETSP1392-20130828/630_1 /ASSEMBLY_ACC=CAM_ASM_000868 /TAXON_ID=225041 /ORGANISM="Chlamydomonas chlamydogama, Strain SAG 11-48b" /LENGTH=327 /DNA_ID=CAMNT_0049573635 /DNA_START=132 /DNA_END=1115 /DNA_ORIENTATION=-